MADGMVESKWQVAFLLAMVILGPPYGGCECASLGN